MPTRSPDNVTEHRITLGRWERERVKSLHEAKVIKDVGIGVGVAAVGIGGTYVAYKIGKGIIDWGEDVIDKVTGDFKSAWEQTTDPSSYNVVDIFTGKRPLPEAPEGEPAPVARDDGWIFGGTPTMFQVAWENTFG